MNTPSLVFGFQKSIFDAAFQKSTIALTSFAHQSPVRDFDFLGCSACGIHANQIIELKAKRFFTRSEASMKNLFALGFRNSRFPMWLRGSKLLKFATTSPRGFCQAGVVAPPDSPNFRNFQLFE
jgi:hypothetical protein